MSSQNSDPERTANEEYVASYLAQPEEVDEGFLVAAIIAQASEPWDEDEPGC